MRLEAAVTGISVGAWLLAGARLSWGAGEAVLELGLYGLYATAAAVGWLAGNVFVHRARRLAPRLRKLLAAVYGVGPAGLVVLTWAMASAELRAAAPLAAIYALLVFTVFFGVPVSLRRAGRSGR